MNGQLITNASCARLLVSAMYKFRFCWLLDGGKDKLIIANHPDGELINIEISSDNKCLADVNVSPHLLLRQNSKIWDTENSDCYTSNSGRLGGFGLFFSHQTGGQLQSMVFELSSSEKEMLDAAITAYYA